jgi:hypothetical protein
MNKVFNLAFKAGISGLLVLVIFGVLLCGVEEIRGPKKPESFLIVFQFGALLGGLALLFGTLILWFEGWIFIIQGWRTRSWLLSLFFIIDSVFFSVFAAYCFHLFRQRQQRRGLGI